MDVHFFIIISVEYREYIAIFVLCSYMEQYIRCVRVTVSQATLKKSVHSLYYSYYWSPLYKIFHQKRLDFGASTSKQVYIVSYNIQTNFSKIQQTLGITRLSESIQYKKHSACSTFYCHC